jgi:hypothetical protein
MRSILVDTNLLLLLVIGYAGKQYIGTHKRASQFVEEDYDLLVATLSKFQTLWVTSHCLSETSNLLRQTHVNLSYKLAMVFSEIFKTAQESHIPMERILGDTLLIRLGVSDTGFAIKSKKVSCSLTVDFDLYSELIRLGRNVINFNHLRQAAWY